MIIDFDQQKVFTQSVDIEDIGNCALRCSTVDFVDYYFCTQTIMGKTYILKFGPIVADLDAFVDDFELQYKKIDYKEKAICKEINMLLNDPKKQIKEVIKIEFEEVMEQVPTADKFVPAE